MEPPVRGAGGFTQDDAGIPRIQIKTNFRRSRAKGPRLGVGVELDPQIFGNPTERISLAFRQREDFDNIMNLGVLKKHEGKFVIGSPPEGSMRFVGKGANGSFGE